MSHPLELILPTHVHLLVLLAVLAVVSFRQPAGSWLRRGRFVWAGLFAWAFVFSIPMFADTMLSSLEGDPTRADIAAPVADPETLIVVLSSGEMRTPIGRTRVRFDVMGWERVHGGVSLWRQTGGRMVFTGGPPGDAENSLAGASGRLARELGVPDADVELSAGAMNTQQEMEQLRDRVRAHRGPVWLVTNALHMRRAVGIAESLGMDFKPWPIGFRQIADHSWRSWVPSNGTLARAQAALHEYIGLAVYSLRKGKTP